MKVIVKPGEKNAIDDLNKVPLEERIRIENEKQLKPFHQIMFGTIILGVIITGIVLLCLTL